MNIACMAENNILCALCAFARQNKSNQKRAAKDMAVITNYRYGPELKTDGTFGVNCAAMDGDIPDFNCRTIHWSREARKDFYETITLRSF